MSEDECGWCGEDHGARCPYVAAYEYDAEGMLRRVEFFPTFHQVEDGAVSVTTIGPKAH